MRFKKAVVVIAMLASGLGAAAQAAAEWKWSDVYVGASVGRSDFRDACSGVSFCDQKDTAWKGFAGYQLNRYLAVELGYQDLGQAALRERDLEGKAWEAVGVASWPFADQFSLYGKAGVYDGKLEMSSASKTKSGATYGFGLRYDVTQNWAVRGEWQRYDRMGGGDLAKTDVDVMGVGVVYRFK